MTPWEAEIDRLIEEQMYAQTFEQRKKLYDRTQELLWEYQPMIFLASPDILTGARKSVGNFRPAVLEPYVLWNVDQLYLKNHAVNGAR
jgi:ABC-type transport system substrate-binding protein